MKIRVTTPEERIAAALRWHRFFAIWPVRIGRDLVMFATVERRGSPHPILPTWDWEYRLPPDRSRPPARNPPLPLWYVQARERMPINEDR